MVLPFSVLPEGLMKGFDIPEFKNRPVTNQETNPICLEWGELLLSTLTQRLRLM
jgi:hypothetical protein